MRKRTILEMRKMFTGALLNKLPFELLEMVCKRLDVTSAFEMERTCSTIRSIMSDRVWEAISRPLNIPSPLPPQMTLKRFLRLVSETGCELCGSQGTRKVTWVFAVRACPECIESHTVRSYMLSSVVEKNAALRVLPHVTVQVWTGRILGERDYQRFWRTSITQFVTLRKTMTGMESTSWWEEQVKQARLRSESLAAISAWETQRALNTSSRLRQVRGSRKAQIVQRCKDLNPPIPIASLSKLDVFERACSYPTPLTERGWHVLKRKILVEHEDQQRIAQAAARAQLAAEKARLERIMREGLEQEATYWTKNETILIEHWKMATSDGKAERAARAWLDTRRWFHEVDCVCQQTAARTCAYSLCRTCCPGEHCTRHPSRPLGITLVSWWRQHAPSSAGCIH